jgi:hypothetical protein
MSKCGRGSQGRSQRSTSLRQVCLIARAVFEKREQRWFSLKLQESKGCMLDQGTGLAGENSIAPGMLGLWYDPERLVIEGVYQDELTAYRARRRWIEALEKNFLLEDTLDFSLKVKRSRSGRNFRVRCDFLTACGRYAFWRLTHHQAPEVQFLLETAHLPHSIPNFSHIEDDFEVEQVGLNDSPDGRLERLPNCHDEVTLRSVLRRVVFKLQGLARRFSELARNSSEA